MVKYTSEQIHVLGRHQLNTKSILSLLLLATAQSKPPAVISPALSWNGFPVRNVTGLLEACSAPSYNRIEVHTKKTCDIAGIKFFMKAVSSDSAREAFAREFAIKNIGVKAPDTQFMYEAEGIAYTIFGLPLESEYYIASQAIEQFIPAAQAIPSWDTVLGWDAQTGYRDAMRANIISAIGEYGLAKCAVALTFFSDMHLNNWGFAKGKLVVIDVDTMPDHLGSFITVAVENIRTAVYHGMELSLNNLKKMKSIYQSMQHKSVPQMPGSANLKQADYDQLLEIYIESCDYAIDKVSAALPTLGANDYSSKINYILASGFKVVDAKYDDSISGKIRRFFT